ncbi:hypothetical protein M3Y96_00737400 [Aphelenchoides besseyi]|nr:hypothetical protein M3Y96_00737400 [Aphelenchoides besseyi]
MRCNWLVALIFLLTPTSALCPNECDCNSDVVDCARRGLTKIPLSIPKNVKRLRLQGNVIADLPLNVFKDLNSLEFLDLNDNNLSQIPQNVFSSIPRLKSLELRKNNFDRVPLAVDLFTGLKHLDLRANAISIVDSDDLIRLSKIEHVDLTRNRISVWPTVSVPLNSTALTRLDLGNNLIGHLTDDHFASLQNLQSIRLAKNRISELSAEMFRDLSHLRSLDLSRNRLHLIRPLTFNSLSSLETLNLARNQLKVQAAAFHGLDNLRSLNLSANRIDPTNLSDGALYGLSSLRELDLSYNQLNSIPMNTWSYVPELKRLYLNGNQLGRLNGAQFPLEYLEFLSLASNKLESIQTNSLRGLKSLVEIDFSDNNLAVCIEDQTVFKNFTLPSLRILHFASNQIRHLPANSFRQFPTLKSLDLRDNPIVTIVGDSFSDLADLQLNTRSLLCDCKLNSFRRWLSKNANSTTKIVAVCQTPVEHVGKNLVEIPIDELTCGKEESPVVRLIQYPHPLVKVLVGQTAELSCSGYGRSPLKISWKVYRKGVAEVVKPKSQKFVFQSNYTHGDRNPKSGNEFVYSSLQVLNSEPSDQAEYQCVVESTFGSYYSDLSTVAVQRKPQIIVRPFDQAVLVGHNALLSCKATGDPQPVIRWVKDDKNGEFPAAVERRLHIREQDDGIYLLNVSLHDSGNYSCKASSDAGLASHSAELSVYERAFKKPLKTKTFNGDSPVFFDCSTVVRQPFEIRWLWNGSVPFNETGRRVFTKAHGQILIIPEISIINNGTVTCELYVNGNQFLSSQTAYLIVRGSRLGSDFELKAARSYVNQRTSTENETVILSSIHWSIVFWCFISAVTFIFVILSTWSFWIWRKRKTKQRADDSESNESEHPLNKQPRGTFD